MRNCPVCGKKVKKNLAHCPHCGANLYAENDGFQAKKQRNIRIKRLHVDIHEFIVVGCILVACLGLLIYKGITKTYDEESNVVSELMVENYVFKTRVAKIDNNAHFVDELIQASFKVKDAQFLDTASKDKNEVKYTGDYTLKEDQTIHFEYIGNSKMKNCSFELDYVDYVDDYSEYEKVIGKVETLLEDIGNHVLSEHLSKDKMHECFMDYYQKHTSKEVNDDDIGYVSIAQSHAFVNFNEDEKGKSIEIKMTFEPCEVLF